MSATSVQEAMQAIKDEEEPLHLSTQEGIDCSYDKVGCGAGWHRWYWNWSIKNGSQTERDYPYVAKEDKCRR